MEGVKAMELFGRELSLEQMVGLVELHATPDEDLVHRAALEIIAALRESQRREKATVEDLTKLATKSITPCHSCAKTCLFPASLAPEYQPPAWCREWQWRGPQKARKAND